MRTWHIIGGTRWAVTDPWQTIATAKTLDTYTDRTEAVQAMRAALGDPQWEPPEDPPRDIQREQEWTVRQTIAGLEDALDRLILDALEDGNG